MPKKSEGVVQSVEICELNLSVLETNRILQVWSAVGLKDDAGCRICVLSGKNEVDLSWA